jgi:hypothetical protein
MLILALVQLLYKLQPVELFLKLTVGIVSIILLKDTLGVLGRLQLMANMPLTEILLTGMAELQKKLKVTKYTINSRSGLKNIAVTPMFKSILSTLTRVLIRRVEQKRFLSMIRMENLLVLQMIGKQHLIEEEEMVTSVSII